MTGQVDEAGRALWAEHFADLLGEKPWQHKPQTLALQFVTYAADQAATAVAALEAERDRLAGQVAAIRALHGKVPEPFLDGERYSCSTCTDGEGNAIDWPCPTLVASSPTTPEAKK